MTGYWGEPYELELSGPVDEAWPDSVAAAVAMKARPLTVFIDSDGGEVQSALAAASMLRRHRVGCTTIVRADGVCFSAAGLVFAAGHTRMAHVSAQFMIHSPALDLAGQRWTAATHRAAASALDRLDDALLDQLAIWCRRPRSAIEAAMGEAPMTALTAQGIGLVNEIEW